MNERNKIASGKVRLRMTTDLTISLNGENELELVANLYDVLRRAYVEGLRIGATPAEISDINMKVAIAPTELTEEEVTRFMASRLNDGNIQPDDIPSRLARYGLQERHEFLTEVLERMSESVY